MGLLSLNPSAEMLFPRKFQESCNTEKLPINVKAHINIIIWQPGLYLRKYTIISFPISFTLSAGKSWAIYKQCCPHLGTTKLIFSANQLTGLYLKRTLVVTGLTNPATSIKLLPKQIITQHERSHQWRNHRVFSSLTRFGHQVRQLYWNLCSGNWLMQRKLAQRNFSMPNCWLGKGLFHNG